MKFKFLHTALHHQEVFGSFADLKFAIQCFCIILHVNAQEMNYYTIIDVYVSSILIMYKVIENFQSTVHQVFVLVLCVNVTK